MSWGNQRQITQKKVQKFNLHLLVKNMIGLQGWKIDILRNIVD
jgi:hypothetical protein